MGRRTRSRTRDADAAFQGRDVHLDVASGATADASIVERRLRWGCAVLVAVVTLVPFLTAVQNEFLTWDDYANFTDNPNYRGLGWRHLQWMWTTFHMGHYMPLTWMTLGLDYVLWGMNSGGYHLTNVLLHTANAVLFYFVALRLLRTAAGAAGRPDRGVLLAAMFSAVLFGIHPLRVESVAWVTERRDVLSGVFCLATVLAYLKACDATAEGRRWYRWSIAIYACALLSKSIAVTVCAVLLILDVYPLRRLGGSVGWWSAAARRVYAEKLAFVVLAAVTSAVAFSALATLDNAQSLATLGIASRIVVSAYSLAFYLWKTILPTGLSPLYEFPPTMDQPVFALSSAFVAILTVGVLALRHRLPGVLAAWVAYVAMLLPVLGLFQNGPQIAADRYTYLANLGWATLAGAALLWIWRRCDSSRRIPPTLPFVGMTIGIAAIMVTLGVLTWRQVHVWRDSERLWSYAISVDPTSAFAHNNLGNVYRRQGKPTEAIEHFRQALLLRPRFAPPHIEWGNTLAEQGKISEAVEHFQAAVLIDPEDADAHNNWGAALLRQGDVVETFKAHFRLMEAMQRGDGKLVVDRQAQLAEAIEHFQHALRVRPDFGPAHANWGLALVQMGKVAEANEHFEHARRLASPVPVATRPWRWVTRAKQRRLPEIRPGGRVGWGVDAAVLASRAADDDDRWQSPETRLARRTRAALGPPARLA